MKKAVTHWQHHKLTTPQCGYLWMIHFASTLFRAKSSCNINKMRAGCQWSLQWGRPPPPAATEELVVIVTVSWMKFQMWAGQYEELEDDLPGASRREAARKFVWGELWTCSTLDWHNVPVLSAAGWLMLSNDQIHSKKKKKKALLSCNFEKLVPGL